MVKFLRKIALFFVLLISLQATAVAQNNYQRSHLWEKEIAAFVLADKKDFPKKEKVLFVGSSSIRGWHNLQKDFPSIYGNGSV